MFIDKMSNGYILTYTDEMPNDYILIAKMSTIDKMTNASIFNKQTAKWQNYNRKIQNDNIAIAKMSTDKIAIHKMANASILINKQTNDNTTLTKCEMTSVY